MGALAPGDAPLADGAVAVFNQGTMGSVVTPDGTLWMSLLRACSGWPSGVWIDGDRRTAPDGSSFAWQHWSHTFRYALASSGRLRDWRAARFNEAAEDYNHDLVAVVSADRAAVSPAAPGGRELEILDVPATEGVRLIGGTAVASDGPGGREHPLARMTHVTLSALKPSGNPLAAGLPGTPAPGRREVTVRLRETDGRPGVAGLRMAAGIEAAWRTDLLEEPAGRPAAGPGDAAGEALTVSDGTALVTLLPFETVTVRVRLSEPADATPAGTGTAPGSAAPLEPAQPVYARYWLHGKGPAPAGNVPVAVHFTPTRVTLGGTAAEHAAGAGTRLELTVACGPAGGRGEVTLIVPDGLTVSVAAPDGSPADPPPGRPRPSPGRPRPSPGRTATAGRSGTTWARTASRPGT